MPSNSKRAYERAFIKNLPTVICPVPAETVTVPAGAVDAIVEAPIRKSPVLNATYTDSAVYGNTSFSFTTGVFTTEVLPKEDADLARGEFWVDYMNGVIRGKKATTGTTFAIAYYCKSIAIEEQTQAENEDNPNRVLATARRKLSTSTYSAPIVVRSTALEASRLIKASAGNLDWFHAQIAPSQGTATLYLQFFNMGTLPPEGTVPDLCVPVTISHVTGTVSNVLRDFSDNPIYFSAGCYAVLSSTQFTKTLAGAVMTIEAHAS